MSRLPVLRKYEWALPWLVGSFLALGSWEYFRTDITGLGPGWSPSFSTEIPGKEFPHWDWLHEEFESAEADSLAIELSPVDAAVAFRRALDGRELNTGGWTYRIIGDYSRRLAGDWYVLKLVSPRIRSRRGEMGTGSFVVAARARSPGARLHARKFDPKQRIEFPLSHIK